jgi:N-methylhydantoinase B/oxoprolinase/acetone carboxylase alpha subunit
MHEIGESRLTKNTLLEHIGVHKRKHGGHISADKHLSGTAVNITGLIEQEAKQEDHNRLETNGGGGWGEATRGDGGTEQ